MDMADAGNIITQIGNQVPLGDLLVIDVVQLLDVGTVHRLHNQLSLIGGGQPEILMVAQLIQRFQYHHNVVLFQHALDTAQEGDDILGGLVVTDCPFGTRLAGQAHDALAAQTFRLLDGFRALLLKTVMLR